MKRIISWVLLAVMMLSLLAGCGNSASAPAIAADPTNAPAAAAPAEEAVVADDNLENAIAYLKAYYKSVRDGDQTPSDFERLGSVRVGLTAYEVVYTVDCDESAVKVVKGSNGMVTIDVNEDSEVEVPYALTATVTGTDGRTASLTWKHVLPVSMSSRSLEIVDAAYALEDGEALPYEVTLKGEIIAVDTPYSADYKNITVSIKVAGREDKPIMCYRLKGDGCENLLPGDIITVTGNIKNYKGTIEFDAGCLLISVEKGENSFEVPTDPQEILEAAFALKAGESLPYQVTLTGRIIGIKSKYSAQYNNISVVIKTGEPWYNVTCYRMKGEDVDKIWLDDIITVTGTLKNYGGHTIEFDTGCIMEEWVNKPDPKAPSDPNEILDQAEKTLGHRDTLPYACTLSGTITKIVSKWSDTFGNITVDIAVDGTGGRTIQCYRMEGPSEDAKNLKVGDNISVYGWVMNYNGKIEFKQGCDLVKVNSKVPVQEKPATLQEQLNDAVANGTNTYESTIQGEIVGTPAYQGSTYDNWNFTVKDSATGLEVYCHNLAKGLKLYAGDVVKVSGCLTSYNGKPQFARNPGATVTVISSTGGGEGGGELTGLAKDLDDASKLANGAYLDRTTTITGTISNTPKASSYNAGQYDFNVNVNGTTVRCYYVPVNGGTPKQGDTVTVTGKLTAYNGGPQFDKTATATLAGGSAPEIPEVDASSPLADIVAAVKAGAVLDFNVTVSGTVKAVYTNGDGTKNIPIITSAGQINCNNVADNGTDGWDNVAAGDTVTMTGKLTLKSGTTDNVRINGATLVSHTPATPACTHENTTTTVTATCTEAGKTTVTCECGEVIDSTDTAALGHDWSNHDGKCARTGCEATCEHGETETVNTATCGAAGKETVTCKTCGKVISETDKEATGAHSFAGNGPTCDNCSEPNTSYVPPVEDGEE